MFSPQSASRLAFSYIAASILAMEHFNKRNASVVPELETIHQNCTFYFDRPTIVDTEANGRRAIRELWRQTVDASTSWPCAVLNPLSAAASSQIVPAIDAFDLPMLSYYREGVSTSKQPNTVALTLSAEGRAKAMVEYFSSLQYLAVWSSFSPFQETFIDVLESNKGSLEVRSIRSQSFPTPKDAMRYLAKTGVTTIYCDLATPSEMSLFAEKLDQLRMLDQGKIFVIPPELAPTDSLNVLYSGVVPGSPLDKLLSGALVFDRLDGFRNKPQSDAFLNVWNSQGKETVRLMNKLVPRTVKYGAAADFFDTEPVNYASYAYDAVMAIGVGGCILEEAKMKLESDSFRFASSITGGNLGNTSSTTATSLVPVEKPEPEPTLPGLVIFEETLDEPVEGTPEETIQRVPGPTEASFEEFDPFQRFVDGQPAKEEEVFQEIVVPDWLGGIDTLIVVNPEKYPTTQPSPFLDNIEEYGDSSSLSNKPPDPAGPLLTDITEFEEENIGRHDPGESQGPSDRKDAGSDEKEGDQEDENRDLPPPNGGTSPQPKPNDLPPKPNPDNLPPRSENDGFDPNNPPLSGGTSDPPDLKDPPPPPNGKPLSRPENGDFDPNRTPLPPKPNDHPPIPNPENPPPRSENDGFDPESPPLSGGTSDPSDLKDPPPPPNDKPLSRPDNGDFDPNRTPLPPNPSDPPPIPNPENSPPRSENDSFDPNSPALNGETSDPLNPNDPSPPPNDKLPPRPDNADLDPNRTPIQPKPNEPPSTLNPENQPLGSENDSIIPSPPAEGDGSTPVFSDSEFDPNVPPVQQQIGQGTSSPTTQPISFGLRFPAETSGDSEPPVTESNQDPSLGLENPLPTENENGVPDDPLSVPLDGQESNSPPLQADGIELPLPQDDRSSSSDGGRGEPSLADQHNNGIEPEISSTLPGTVEDDPATGTSDTPPNESLDFVGEQAAILDVAVSPTQEVPQSGAELLVEAETQSNEATDLSRDPPVDPEGIETAQHENSQSGDETSHQQANEVDPEPNHEQNRNPLTPPPRDSGSQKRNGQRLLDEVEVEEAQEESVTTLLEAIRKSSFTGASGRIRFGDESGNERNSHDIPMGLYNIVPGEINPETNTRAYNIVLVSKFEQESGWKPVPRTRIFHRDASKQAIAFEGNYLSTHVRAVGLTLMALAWIICLAGSISVYVLRKDAAVQRAQPFFMQILCCGSFVMSASIFLLSWDEGAGWTHAALDRACALTPWFFFSGQIITFCALFTKLWRVDEVLQFRRRAVSISNVMKPTLGLMFTTFVLLVSWTIVEPWSWSRHEIREVPPETYGQCQSSTFWYFFGPLVGLLFFAESLTLYFAWKTADVPEDFRDSGAVFYASFAQLQSWAVGAPMLVVLGTTNADATYFGRIFLIWIFAVSSVVVVVGPKVVKAITIRRNPEKKSSRVHISGLQQQQRPESARSPLPSNARTASVKFSDVEKA